MVFYGLAGPQNPIYGIFHENITERLTRHNWRTKAVVRDNLLGWIYLWIARGSYPDKAGHTHYAYFVRVDSHQPRFRIERFEQQFQYLADALRYINAEDGGSLARGTWPADPQLVYPPERAAPIYIGFGRPTKLTPDP